MAPQNESNQKPRNEETEGIDQDLRPVDARSPELESEHVEPEPFSDSDPFRAARTREVVSETSGILAEVQAEPTGFDDVTDKQFAGLYADAIERAKWNPARSDGFRGLLRLGRSVPPRAQRVL